MLHFSMYILEKSENHIQRQYWVKLFSLLNYKLLESKKSVLYCFPPLEIDLAYCFHPISTGPSDRSFYPIFNKVLTT